MTLKDDRRFKKKERENKNERSCRVVTEVAEKGHLARATRSHGSSPTSHPR